MTRKNRYIEWGFWFTTMCLVVVGLSFIVLSQIVESNFLKATFSNLASALIVAGTFTLINEKLLKDNLIELILRKLSLKKEIDETGIESVYTDVCDVDYRFYIRNAKKSIDILHVYGRSWTTHNLEEVQDKLMHSNCVVRVILVAPDSPFIEGLANHYNTSVDELRLRINDVTKMWVSLSKKKKQRKKRTTQSQFKLYYHYGQPSSALYRFDDRIINVQNNFAGGRTKKLTTLVCVDTKKCNDIYNNFINEIDELIKISVEQNIN